MDIVNNDLIDKYRELPSEIIHKIISYNGSLKWRNGKYIDQINKDDYRYYMLQKIPRPFCYHSSHFLFHHIIFFPSPIYSLTKRCLHVYCSSDGQIRYLLDVEEMFVIHMYLFVRSTNNVIPVESNVISIPINDW